MGGGTTARLGLDSETPWLWGLSVAPPSKEGLGVIHRSNQELGIFWPHEEASASVIGGTQRWGGEGRRGGGGESQILEDPAQFLKTVIVSSQLIWKLRRSSQLSLSTFTFFVILSWRMILVILCLYTTWRGCDCIESSWNTCFKICQCEGVLSNATEKIPVENCGSHYLCLSWSICNLKPQN